MKEQINFDWLKLMFWDTALQTFSNMKNIVIIACMVILLLFFHIRSFSEVYVIISYMYLMKIFALEEQKTMRKWRGWRVCCAWHSFTISWATDARTLSLSQQQATHATTPSLQCYKVSKWRWKYPCIYPQNCKSMCISGEKTRPFLRPKALQTPLLGKFTLNYTQIASLLSTLVRITLSLGMG